MRRPQRDDRFLMRLSKAEKLRLHELAIQRDVSASQLLRQLLKSVESEAGERRTR
jgi:hypothetical protein